MSRRKIQVISSDARPVARMVGGVVTEISDDRARLADRMRRTALALRALAEMLEEPDAMPGPVIRSLRAITPELMTTSEAIVMYYAVRGEAVK